MELLFNHPVEIFLLKIEAGIPLKNIDTNFSVSICFANITKNFYMLDCRYFNCHLQQKQNKIKKTFTTIVYQIIE